MGIWEATTRFLQRSLGLRPSRNTGRSYRFIQKEQMTEEENQLKSEEKKRVKTESERLKKYKAVKSSLMPLLIRGCFPFIRESDCRRDTAKGNQKAVVEQCSYTHTPLSWICAIRAPYELNNRCFCRIPAHFFWGFWVEWKQSYPMAQTQCRLGFVHADSPHVKPEPITVLHLGSVGWLLIDYTEQQDRDANSLSILIQFVAKAKQITITTLNTQRIYL